jgi:diacylglycerol kinase family enzyme
MKKNSTLIYFVNNFNSEEKNQCRVEDVDTDLLTAMEFNPSERSIENIMNFARSYEVFETENTGQIEMILN